MTTHLQGAALHRLRGWQPPRAILPLAFLPFTRFSNAISDTNEAGRSYTLSPRTAF